MLNQLLEICIKDHIPIVRDKTLSLIKDLINKQGCRSILEIGTAYGYSAYCLAEINNVQRIVTIEKNLHNFNIAKDFLKNPKIEMILADAFEFNTNEKFDLIFIDGPKSHQEKLVQHYLNFLNKNGAMVIDNLYLKKFDVQESLTKNQIKLKNKINDFRNWLLKDLKNCNFKIYDIDDGVGIITNVSNQ